MTGILKICITFKVVTVRLAAEFSTELSQARNNRVTSLITERKQLQLKNSTCNKNFFQKWR